MKQEYKEELLLLINKSIERHQAEIYNRQKWEAWHKQNMKIDPNYDFEWSNNVKQKHISKIKMLNEIKEEINNYTK